MEFSVWSFAMNHEWCQPSFYLESCFITNWRSPNPPRSAVPCLSEACLLLATGVSDGRWRSADLQWQLNLCRLHSNPRLQAKEAFSSLAVSVLLGFLFSWLFSACGGLQLRGQVSRTAFVFLPSLMNLPPLPRLCSSFYELETLEVKHRRTRGTGLEFR